MKRRTRLRALRKIRSSRDHVLSEDNVGRKARLLLTATSAARVTRNNGVLNSVEVSMWDGAEILTGRFVHMCDALDQAARIVYQYEIEHLPRARPL